MSKQLVILLIFLHTTLILSLSVSAQDYTDPSTAYPPALWTNNQTFNRILNPENNSADLYFTFICDQSQNCVLGVVSYYSTEQLVVWCANRDHPVKENATLNFVQDGNLVLHDADGSLVWSTNTTGSSVVGMKLMDNWNLVLFDKNDVSIWESFDYPTDTWLPGQALKVGQQLTANSSAASLGTGQFFLNITSAVMEAYINSSPPQLYFRYQLPNMRVTTNVTFSSGRLVVPYSVRSPFATDGIELSPLGPSSSPQFLRLDSDGHLRYYEIVDYKVNLLSDVFSYIGFDDCAYPTVCGKYGICLENDCSCPDSYFKPVDERQLHRGCLPLTPLSCQSTENHALLRLDNVTHFIYNAVHEEKDLDASIFSQNITVEQCRQACLRNCTCKAAFFFKFAEDRSDGYCYLTSQLYSLMSNNPETTGYNSSAYIKVETSANSLSSNSSKGSHRIRKEGVTIVGVVLGSLFIALLTISFTILFIEIKLDFELGLIMGS